MAAGSNPLAAMVMSALMSRSGQGGTPPGGGPAALAGGGAPGGAPGGQPPNPLFPGTGPMSPTGGGPDTASQYAQQVSELRGADPGGLLRQLKSIKQIFAVMLVQNLDRLPNVSGKIAKLVPMMDQVIKEVQQASSVNSAVRNPIQMGAATPPTTEGQGGGGGSTF